MSIIVKGMKMPKNCSECDFCHWSNLHQTGICDRCGDEPVCPDYGTDYRRTRARFCPLVELPEKHGSLIDANLQPTCNNLATDCISRQEAIDIFDDYNVSVENGELEAYSRDRKRLCDLPPVQPELGENSPSEQPKTNELGVKTGATCTDTISRQAAIDANTRAVER